MPVEAEFGSLARLEGFRWVWRRQILRWGLHDGIIVLLVREHADFDSGELIRYCEEGLLEPVKQHGAPAVELDLVRLEEPWCEASMHFRQTHATQHAVVEDAARVFILDSLFAAQNVMSSKLS